MKLSIIIVSFNTRRLLAKCLGSLEEKGRFLAGEVEVFVVDNASSDGSVEMVKAKFPEAKLIQNKKNLGFAKANNQALKKASGDYLLLLNSDTQVKPGALEVMVNFTQKHPKAGVVGARLLNPDGSLQASVYHLPSVGRAIAQYWLGRKSAYEKYSVLGERVVEVEAVVGAAMLVPKKVAEKVGLLGERYFMYFEDIDYCRRVSEAGFKIYYLPKAEVVHYHGQSAVKVGSQAYRYLKESSKIYHGLARYWVLFFILWTGQKWQKLLGKN